MPTLRFIPSSIGTYLPAETLGHSLNDIAQDVGAFLGLGSCQDGPEASSSTRSAGEVTRTGFTTSYADTSSLSVAA